MPIDDPESQSEVHLEIVRESEKTIPEMYGRAVTAGVIAMLPFGIAAVPFGIGSGIVAGFSEHYGKRIHERMRTMWESFSSRIRTLEEQKVDKEWFQSEEFQALMIECVHQLRSVYDLPRIKLLGSALANGAANEFSNESHKEVFVRLIRELTPEHIAILKRLSPKEDPEIHDREWTWGNRPRISSSSDESRLVLRMLVSDGLAEEEFAKPSHLPNFRYVSSVEDAAKKMEDVMKQMSNMTKSHFKLSPLGRDFLHFIAFDEVITCERDGNSTFTED